MKALPATTIPLLALSLLCGLTATAGESNESVQVKALRDPDWKSYRAFIAGIDEFERSHHLAPTASLRFVLYPKREGLPVAGATLHIKGSRVAIPVPLEQDGTFALPREQLAVEDDAELILNRRQGQFRWRPAIHSSGVPHGMRRLGDLRLECAVRWAIEQNDVPLLMRMVFNSGNGPCHSRQIKVMYFGPRPLTSVSLTAPGRRELLDSQRIESAAGLYAPPLDDVSWPDETLIQFN